MVERRDKDLSPLEKSLKITVLSSLGETLGTSSGERKKVGRFFDPKNPRNLVSFFSRANARVYGSTSVRLFWTGGVTYISTYAMTEQVRPYLPQEYQQGPLAKSIAGTICGFGVQPVVMPLLNLQTRILANPNQKITTTAQTFFSSGAKKIWAGLGLRALCQAGRYGVGLGLAEAMAGKKSEEEVSNSKKRSMR